ncbi:MAG: hypothetical protein DMD99_22380 [Candidatus Rokuibacteriota bacterium]|nr:MAG: hypothetical protein DMD99_22380 [Candidatus Rokubacteria bacterium]
MSTGDPHVHALRRRALDRGDLQQEVRARLTSAVGGPVGHAQTRARPAGDLERQRREVRAMYMAPRAFHHLPCYRLSRR